MVLVQVGYGPARVHAAEPGRDRPGLAAVGPRAPAPPHAGHQGPGHPPLGWPGPPRPAPPGTGYGRRLFTGDAVEAGLDALVGAQDGDGGWDIGFPSWTPLTRPEWRGFTTVERLLTLRAYGQAQALNHSRFPTGSPASSRTSCAKWAWSA
ncbi:Uncharacterised protein [Mycobacterium tuberculosis]|nr:Uncharacterised protein [Mycobacterium tuberculosis]